MSSNELKSHLRQKRGITFKRSFLAMCIMALSAPGFAQDATDNTQTAKDGDVEEVLVTGMRQALGSAQDIKRESATVVDSITADDMGAFPDKSVAEALQRVAGITVNRFAASSDTAHFSAEPSGVIVRGLNQVRTEFNGRDSFSANSSRGLSWGDVSPELMAGVDTYKNQMAELIEGGIAGTVNMRTRVPFDQSGQMIAVSVNANYGDLSEEVTPEFSGLYSNRWDSAVGEWGLLVNYAHSEVTTRSQGNQLYRMNRFSDVYDVDIGGDGVSTNTSNGADSLVYIPARVMFRDNIYERERNGAALAAQWKNLDDTLVATFQYNSSKYDNAWEEYVVDIGPADLSYAQSVFFEIQPDGTGATPVSAPQPLSSDNPFTFADNGLFQTGMMTADIGWWGGSPEEAAKFAHNSSGQNMVNPCYAWQPCSPTRRGIDFDTTTRSNNNTNKTQDFGFNLKWTPTDKFSGVFDVQYVKSEVKNYDIEVQFSSFADAYLDLTGERPTLDLSAPTNVNQSEGGLTNANNYYIKSIMDHVEDSDGNELAVRADFEYEVDNGWLQSIKAGARFADRDQTVRYSGYNWQNVSNTWTGTNGAYWNLDSYDPATVVLETKKDENGVEVLDSNGNPIVTKSFDFKGYPKGYFETRKFKSDYFNLNQSQFVFADMNLLQNQQKMASALSASSLGFTENGIGWDPICSNTGDRAGEVSGTCFTPAEVVDVSEETHALYVQFNFGGDDLNLFGKPVTGNLGVRYIQTELISTGGTVFNKPGSSLNCVDRQKPQGTPDDAKYVERSVGCYLSADDLAFMNDGNVLSSSTNKFNNVLPSLNVKVELNDEWLMRLALSRAMSRPDIGNLRNYYSISPTLPSESNYDDPLWVKDDANDIVGAKVKYSASSQNPRLKPVIADQIDISIERYFAKVGSFTLTAFYKEFSDYIQFGTYYADFTNEGVTRTVEVKGPLNGNGANLDGFEVSYQSFFDFLPEPFDGFGVQANYTRINNNGIQNTNIQNTGGSGTTITSQSPDAISVNTLEGLSKNSANFVLMYEKGDWATRLAYSWRSEFMVTAIDCCVAYPIWNQATGQLDGSIRYSFNDNIEISLSASNLLNEQTKLQQQIGNYEDGGLRMPNAWFQNDRRYTLGVRFKY